MFDRLKNKYEDTAEKKKFTIETTSLRAYTMLGALILIWLFFHFATSNSSAEWTDVFGNLAAFFNGIVNFFKNLLFGTQSETWVTGGIFLTPRNLSNLMLQTSVTGILAIGMLLVIVSGNIDLSVGSVLGLAGGVSAILLTNSGYGIVSAIFITIIVAVAVGLFQGSLIAYLNIPAFIVTLGGLLAWRGLLKGISHSETIPIADQTFKVIGQRGIDQMSGWILAGTGILFVLFLVFRRARSRKTYGLGEANYWGELIKSLFPVVAIILFIFVMNSAEGVPLPVLIFLTLAVIGLFITNSTTFGRYLYAIGGNSDAARLSGIDTKWNILKVYMFLGILTGIAAVICTARQGSASPDAGVLKELDARLPPA